MFTIIIIILMILAVTVFFALKTYFLFKKQCCVRVSRTKIQRISDLEILEILEHVGIRSIFSKATMAGCRGTRAKFNSSPLKNGGRKTTFLFLKVTFQGLY